MAPPRISEAALDAAIHKAVEAGIFPRRGNEFDAVINREVMRAILEAAFAAFKLEEESEDDCGQHRVRSEEDSDPLAHKKTTGRQHRSVAN